jgi:hypothetical protein
LPFIEPAELAGRGQQERHCTGRVLRATVAEAMFGGGSRPETVIEMRVEGALFDTPPGAR